MAGLNFFDSKECEWKDISLSIAGVPLVKVTNISYKSMRDSEPLHAAGDKPISIQHGNRTYEGSFTLLKGAVDNMNAAAVAAGGNDLLDLTFDATVTYKAQGARALQVDVIMGISVTEFEKKWAQGDKKGEVALPFKCLQIV